jgi:carboxypeptidase Taq
MPGTLASGAYTELKNRLAEVHDLGRARDILIWDERTMMPPNGAAVRAEQLATLARVRHEKATSDELGLLLDELVPYEESQPYGSDEASLIRVARRDWEKARRVPAQLRMEMARAASLGEFCWREARTKSDFEMFQPYLARNVELARRYVECFPDIEHMYDPLLDDFEPGMKTAEITAVLEELKAGLLPLNAAIAERAGEVDDAPLHGDFPIEQQRALAAALVRGLPVDAASWRIDETAHPFESAFATGDVRITTRYDEHYVGSAVFSLVHEFGHGLYEHDVDPALERTPLCRGVSLGLHESQSRMWENRVGRSRAFLRWCKPLLEEHFPGRFKSIDSEQLYRAANKAQASLIRVDADETTYDLHIILRFELEQEIFQGTLELSDLPEAWNERVKNYLGLDTPDDAHGVLQDVHWSDGSFGYFPTYSLGNVIAGQIWKRMNEALPDLETRIEAGDFAPLHEWLREHLHRHGRKFTPAETVERVAGGPVDVGPYLEYLERKYGELYSLKKIERR